jgi:hypothetical protein
MKGEAWRLPRKLKKRVKYWTLLTAKICWRNSKRPKLSLSRRAFAAEHRAYLKHWGQKPHSKLRNFNEEIEAFKK